MFQCPTKHGQCMVLHGTKPMLIGKILTLLIVLSAACSQNDSKEDPLGPVSLTFGTTWGEGDTEDTVSIDQDGVLGNARLWSTDGTSLQISIAPEERSALYELFENKELTDVYLQDSVENAPDSPEYIGAPGPNCTDTDTDIQTICQALNIAQVHATGGVQQFSPPAYFFFREPTNLSLETARMLVVLNELRLRIREHGEPVSAEN